MDAQERSSARRVSSKSKQGLNLVPINMPRSPQRVTHTGDVHGKGKRDASKENKSIGINNLQQNVQPAHASHKKSLLNYGAILLPDKSIDKSIDKSMQIKEGDDYDTDEPVPPIFDDPRKTPRPSKTAPVQEAVNNANSTSKISTFPDQHIEVVSATEDHTAVETFVEEAASKRRVLKRKFQDKVPAIRQQSVSYMLGWDEEEDDKPLIS